MFFFDNLRSDFISMILIFGTIIRFKLIDVNFFFNRTHFKGIKIKERNNIYTLIFFFSNQFFIQMVIYKK